LPVRHAHWHIALRYSRPISRKVIVKISTSHIGLLQVTVRFPGWHASDLRDNRFAGKIKNGCVEHATPSFFAFIKGHEVKTGELNAPLPATFAV